MTNTPKADALRVLRERQTRLTADKRAIANHALASAETKTRKVKRRKPS